MDNRIWWPSKTATGKPRKKKFLSETAERMPISTFWADIKGQSGADEVDNILGGRLFDFPKACEFVCRVIDLCTGPNSIVLDSFAGSGTTAHAVLEVNRRDLGNRQFVLVECEDYANSVTAERVRRVINGYAFNGTQRTELLRENLSWRSLQSAEAIIQKVEGIQTLHGGEYDRITKQVREGELIVTGEKGVTGGAEGLGGTFTYCTLGDAGRAGQGVERRNAARL